MFVLYKIKNDISARKTFCWDCPNSVKIPISFNPTTRRYSACSNFRWLKVEISEKRDQNLLTRPVSFIWDLNKIKMIEELNKLQWIWILIFSQKTLFKHQSPSPSEYFNIYLPFEAVQGIVFENHDAKKSNER